MSIWWILVIVLSVISIFTFILCKIDGFANEFIIMSLVTTIILVILFASIGIGQPIVVKQELLRQNKERQQILYQVEHITEDSDRVKLNEWILTYNDWVNDVNTSKEMYGFASRYHSVDMSEHTIINLV